MSVRPASFRRARENANSLTSMQLAKRDRENRERRERERAEDIDRTLAAANDGWVVIAPRDDFDRDVSYFHYRVSYIKRVALEARGFVWESFTQQCEDDDYTFNAPRWRIIMVNALAKLHLADCDSKTVIIACPAKTGSESVDKAAWHRWRGIVQAVIDFAKIANDTAYRRVYNWNANWRKTDKFVIQKGAKAA